MSKQYKITRKARGKARVVETGNLSKMQNRLKQLRKSTCHGVCGQGRKKYKAEYQIEEA